MQRFVLSVVAAGSLAIFITVAVGLPHLRLDAVALTLVACTVAAESVPIKIPRHGFIEELTCSFTFAFALLLYSGPVLAILSLVLASVASDLRHRKPFVRLLFNASQYALGMGAAAGSSPSSATSPPGTPARRSCPRTCRPSCSRRAASSR
jgi:hypothetical protein